VAAEERLLSEAKTFQSAGQQHWLVGRLRHGIAEKEGRGRLNAQDGEAQKSPRRGFIASARRKKAQAVSKMRTTQRSYDQNCLGRNFAGTTEPKPKRKPAAAGTSMARAHSGF
jgi:hypothetical protein